MFVEQTAKSLFIVDNSVEGWTCLRYLEKWAEISKAFDIATGYFEIGSLLALDKKWQALEKIRILMGSEMTIRTQKTLLEGIQANAIAKLDGSLNGEKGNNPFLLGVTAILDGLRTGKIECRVYDKSKFHAKTYITHAKFEVVGSQALVGSSNFTLPGLTGNIELNVQIQSAREVAQLQEWFDAHWNEGKDVTPQLIGVVETHVREFSPFEVYAKALQEFFKGRELSAEEWDATESKLFGILAAYQKEAYRSLMKIALQHDGALLCDGVGLGKTFVGLMLIERLILKDRKRVVLFAPKGAKEGVWEPHLRRYLPHIGSKDYSNLSVFSHTDLTRTGEFPQRFKDIAALADVVIIDEAHHFRNRGIEGDVNDPETRSRYHRLADLISGSNHPKKVFMLTATPINNHVKDLRNMIELFTNGNDKHFAQTIGVNSLRSHFRKLGADIDERLGEAALNLGENTTEIQAEMSDDLIVKALIVQRSRAYAWASQKQEGAGELIFPIREDPIVAKYSIKSAYGRLLELVTEALTAAAPLFTLSIYYPLAYYLGPADEVDAFEENRQKQVVSLIRTQFLKRFESSITAFELSCNKLLGKFLAFLEVYCTLESHIKQLENWKIKNAELIDHVYQRQMELWPESPEDIDDDIVPDEFVEDFKKRKNDFDKCDINRIIDETFRDLDQIIEFVKETRKFNTSHDDKLKKLVALLKSKDLADQKILVFTEFADTARYLKRELVKAGIEGVAQIDSATKGNRIDIIRQFAPYYNESTSAELIKAGKREIRVLISTDVLSEGLNLQDASRLINYDIHWNPVRLMQRIGRVDRRMNVNIEKIIKQNHPETARFRGKIRFWNFLPPDELNTILSLYTKVTNKALVISKTIGIEGRKFLTPEDDYDALKEFNGKYEGEETPIEKMHLEYQSFLQADPDIEARLSALPLAIFSGRKKPEQGTVGVFFCYSLPALDNQKTPPEFTLEAGNAAWYFYNIEHKTIIEDPVAIHEFIRSVKNTPRFCNESTDTLKNIRDDVRRHISRTYLKRVNASVGAEPVLRCWMELNSGT